MTPTFWSHLWDWILMILTATVVVCLSIVLLLLTLVICLSPFVFALWASLWIFRSFGLL